MNQKGSVIGGALLVAGTTIGGGMLALPVLTSLAGFLPSFAIYILCWVFMAGTGLLFLEISQWMTERAKADSNIITMAKQTLGKSGEYTAWILYLFLFYCLTVAYIVGCGNLVVEFSQNRLPDWMGSVLFVVLFIPLLLVKTSWIGRLNVLLVAGLAISYFAFVVLGFGYVQPEFLSHSNWSHSLTVLPIAFTSFAYQGIIPTLAHYMHYEAKKIRQAILIGSFIPLITYVVWEWLILGIVPTHAPGGLSEALQQGQNAVMPLKNFLQHASVYTIGQFFAFFALVTSCLGVTLGLRDFLSDGLNIEKTPKGNVLLVGLIFIIPLSIAIVYPNIFLTALDYAGGFGCAILLGLMPILMVWSGRYRQGLNHCQQVPGGKFLLVVMGIFVAFEILMELSHVFSRLYPSIN